jgi:Aerotolerance regulator N-terminal
MSFLQPWLLVALPLVTLPIVIHLINQRRFQTIPWAAMMFLLAAQRMARGYSRLRQWLIMLFRMLVVAGLVLAVSRPLASGWLGLVGGGRADTTIVLLDRSPSMQEQSAGGGDSKLETARRQLVSILNTVGSNRWVLIDGASRAARELESPAALLGLPTAGPASAPADLPLMLQAAHDYIRDQRTGRTEIWICSDLRANDWTADSGRWGALRETFRQFPQGVRIQLLAYPQRAAGNVAVRVTNVRRQVTKEGAELLVSVRLSRTGGEEKRELPLQFEIEGGRSVVNIEMTGPQTDLREHRIPIEASRQRGFGRVSIPADANAADNDFFFVFDDLPPRRTLVIADEPQAALPLQLAAGISADEKIQCSSESLAVEQLSAVAWDQISLVLWQAPLPTGTAAELIETYVERGGQVVFFPPREPGAAEQFGQRWDGWADGEKMPVENWRGDADLLARTQSGAALPVGQLEIHRYCQLRGEATQLATLRGGAPLLARVPTDRGGVYFWTTTPAPQDSTLATNGVVLYAFVQRALAAGSSVLGRTRWLDAGNSSGESPSTWQRLSGGAEGLSTEAACHSGIYSADDKLLAVNRPLAEDDSKVLTDPVVSELFRGLEFTRVDDRAGNASALIQEIWRIFLSVMLAALVLEAVLCLPRLTHSGRATA